MSANYVEFDAPEGYAPPEGAMPDKGYDGLATFRMNPNGKICITHIGGLPVSKSSQAPERTTGQGMVQAYKQPQ